MIIKIIAFNIKKGFCDKYRMNKYKINVKRQTLAQNMIKNEKPHIIILTEACFVKNNPTGIRNDYKKIFGYKYGFFGSDLYKNVDWGVGVLSRFPIIKAEDYTTKHTRFTRVSLEAGKKIIQLDAVHPDPSLNEFQRMHWFKGIIRDIRTPYILAGDFNAFSPQDNYDKKKLIKGFKPALGLKKAKAIEGEILTGQSINLLLEKGLVDTFKKKNRNWDYSYHTDMNKNPYDYSRIDYIFCSKDFKILKSGIIKNQQTEQTSDHYPVYAILGI